MCMHIPSFTIEVCFVHLLCVLCLYPPNLDIKEVDINDILPDFAEVWRCSNESNHDHTTLNAANVLLLRLCRGSERFK